ncbi:hydroxypyruvate isomerase family protein [Shimia marina]|uniref:Putative hydroxypyruvate isomerase YgbM n=1 Tax=Shimia marina TaxID=321267 RepID=A0A0P1EL80_9RHOB|nr:TIM barrel protein [Shimia marina]CUH51186.1 Putative hydroxypyruvate isomerase YgbM [Shimia marina]SFD55665.1 hydroxypyruvate isomerase [Shimia marina]
MPRFAANLTLLFAEFPELDRYDAAAEAGFEAVEVLFPYDTPGPETQRALLRNGLSLELINCPPPNYTGGDRGFAAVPGLSERFQRDFRRTLRYAQMLRARLVHIMAGAASGADARQTFVENLKWACDFAPQQQLTIEPINDVDMPGYFLNDFDLAAEILDEVNAPNLALQFDTYHAFRIHGDVIACWEKHKSRVRHVQIGGLPDRHEPIASKHLDYPAFFKMLDESGYSGVVSAEYTPKKRTEQGLGWLK